MCLGGGDWLESPFDFFLFLYGFGGGGGGKLLL